MNKDFAKTWKSSKQPRKQRKYRHNLPLHQRKKFMSAPLSKDLRKKYTTRTVGVKKGDKVKIMRGNFKGKIGKIERVNLKKNKVYITGMEKTKLEGSKAFVPFEPSNIMIQELDLKDSRRLKQIKKQTKDKSAKKE